MATKTWNGSSADWYTAADWGGIVPAPGDDAVIPGGTAVLNGGDTGITVTSITINSGGSFEIFDPGQTQSVTGNLSDSGFLGVDNSRVGGSTLTIGGTLSNTNFVQIGNSNISSATTVTAAGLSNTGRIDIDGGSSAQATLDISAAAPVTWTGTLNVSGDGLLEFDGTSGIGAIAGGAQINLFGPHAFVASAGLGTTSNTGLSRLSSNAGQLQLQSGASLATTVGLSNSGGLYINKSYGQKLVTA